MRTHAGVTGAAALVTLAALSVLAQDGVLEVKGIGAEGKPRYQGGKVEFQDVTIADRLVHLADAETIPLRLSVSYNVLETAPVLLTSRMGTEYWRLCQYGSFAMSALHTRERIDLSQPGVATATAETARIAARYGPSLSKGLVGIRGRSYFLVDQPDGLWLDVVRPPGFFDRPELVPKLTFTLADLTSYSLSIPPVESTWSPGALLRVKLLVTDAGSERFPVIPTEATVTAGEWYTALQVDLDELNTPSGWLTAALPETAVPAEIEVRMTVRAMTPKGPEVKEVHRLVLRGEGQKTEEEISRAAGLSILPRTAEGVIRETRAIWVNPRSFQTVEQVETLVDRVAAAGLNVIVPDIFVRSMFIGKSELFPMYSKVEKGFDPLARMIELAHMKGIEVHPWFCVTYRDANFRKSLPGVDVVDAKGKVAPLPADVHRPEYRDFIVALMVDVARNYDVNGIHLDYIRAMERCHCRKCRDEFRQQFGKPLEEATDDDWIVWQRQAVGEIVRRTAEGVRAVKPKAILSAAVFSNLRSGALQGQDPAGWASNGWLDMVIPMDYKMDSLGVKDAEQTFLGALEDDGKLVTGLSLYARHGGKAEPRSAVLVGQQIRLVRRLDIHGWCLFEFQYLDDAILDLLRNNYTSEKAVPYFR